MSIYDKHLTFEANAARIVSEAPEGYLEERIGEALAEAYEHGWSDGLSDDEEMEAL